MLETGVETKNSHSNFHCFFLHALFFLQGQIPTFPLLIKKERSKSSQRRSVGAQMKSRRQQPHRTPRLPIVALPRRAARPPSSSNVGIVDTAHRRTPPTRLGHDSIVSPPRARQRDSAHPRGASTPPAPKSPMTRLASATQHAQSCSRLEPSADKQLKRSMR